MKRSVCLCLSNNKQRFISLIHDVCLLQASESNNDDEVSFVGLFLSMMFVNCKPPKAFLPHLFTTQPKIFIFFRRTTTYFKFFMCFFDFKFIFLIYWLSAFSISYLFTQSSFNAFMSKIGIGKVQTTSWTNFWIIQKYYIPAFTRERGNNQISHICKVICIKSIKQIFEKQCPSKVP